MSDVVTEVKLCTVSSPTSLIVKARAELLSDQLRVMDRKRNIILVVDAPREETANGVWTYGDTIVTRTSGCGCGGTRIQQR